MKIIGMLGLVLLAGCMTAPRDRAADKVYDFGVSPTLGASAVKLQGSVMVAEAGAKAWLDTPAIQYRLGYHDPTQLRAYAQSRWAAPPSALLTERLKSHAASLSHEGVVGANDEVRSDYVLRVELEEFTQVFDSAEQSRGIAQLRASLIDRNTRALIAQQRFRAERLAPTPNAEGAAHALTAASDELVVAVTDWLAKKMEESNKQRRDKKS